MLPAETWTAEKFREVMGKLIEEAKSLTLQCFPGAVGPWKEGFLPWDTTWILDRAPAHEKKGNAKWLSDSGIRHFLVAKDGRPQWGGSSPDLNSIEPLIWKIKKDALALIWKKYRSKGKGNVGRAEAIECLKLAWEQ